jgi:hypothetical protein
MLQRVQHRPRAIKIPRAPHGVDQFEAVVQARAEHGVGLSQCAHAEEFACERVVRRTAVLKELDKVEVLFREQILDRTSKADALADAPHGALVHRQPDVAREFIQVERATVVSVRERQSIDAIETLELMPRHREKKRDLVPIAQQQLRRVVQEHATPAPIGRVDLVGDKADLRHGSAECIARRSVEECFDGLP